MAKDKDANDTLVENQKKGKKAKLRIVENDEPYIPDNDTDEINDKYLARMNEKHAFISTVGGKPMVMCRTYSEVYKKDIVEFRTPDAIITQYNNESIFTGNKSFGNKETVGLGKWWVNHPDRRQYDTVIFDPAEPSGLVKSKDSDDPRLGYWNLWEGFAVQPKQGYWKKGKKHIHTVLCNRDSEKFHYFMRWMAFVVQKPGTRSMVASIFRGEQGAGKGWIFTQLMKIFGIHGMPISNPEHLTGKHNSHLMAICFLFADEAYYPGNKDVAGTLKVLITEPYLTVEPKFQNVKLAINCLNLGMSTNADWVIPASKDARRFFINTVDNKYAYGRCPKWKRDEYFNALWGEMDNGGREAMLYDLLRIDISNFSPENHLPETSEMKRQMAISLNRKEKHIQAFLEHGIFPGILTSQKQYIVASGDLIDFMDKIDPGNKVPMRLKAEVLTQLGATPVRIESKRMWLFPDLTTLKKRFNEEICAIDWPDYEDWEARGSTNY